MLIDAYSASTEEDTHPKTLTNKVYIIKNTKASKDGEPLYEIHIDKEYHTMGNVISKYSHIEDKTLDYVSYKLAHVLTHKVIIMVKSPDYKKNSPQRYRCVHQ